jgi:hypothetical protein
MPTNRQEKNELIIEVDDNYDIEVSDVPAGLPATFEGSAIRWLGNVSVTLKRGKPETPGARYRVAHKDGRQCVYFKGNRVQRLPNDNMLPVGDPPIGMI